MLLLFQTLLIKVISVFLLLCYNNTYEISTALKTHIRKQVHRQKFYVNTRHSNIPPCYLGKRLIGRNESNTKMSLPPRNWLNHGFAKFVLSKDFYSIPFCYVTISCENHNHPLKLYWYFHTLLNNGVKNMTDFKKSRFRQEFN